MTSANYSMPTEEERAAPRSCRGIAIGRAESVRRAAWSTGRGGCPARMSRARGILLGGAASIIPGSP